MAETMYGMPPRSLDEARKKEADPQPLPSANEQEKLWGLVSNNTGLLAACRTRGTTRRLRNSA